MRTAFTATVATAFFSAAALAATAQAGEVFGLKGDKLGSTLGGFQQRHDTDRSCVAEVPVWHAMGTSGMSWGLAQCDTTIAGQRSMVIYYYLSQDAARPTEARLWRISANLKKESFEDVRAVYLAGFGRPKRDEQIPEEIVSWNNGASSIQLVRNAFGFTVEYEHQDLARLYEKAKQQEAKDLAKDL